MPAFGSAGERIGYRLVRHAEGGPPLLLLHGFGASSASFMANVPELGEHFTLLTVDLLGHGESDAPADSSAYTPDRAADRIADLLDHFGFDRVLVCGHSLGGALALRFALAHPARVAGLVLINSNSAAGDAAWRETAQHALRTMADRVRREGTAFLKDTRLYPGRGSRLPEDARQQLAADFERLSPEGVAGTAEGLTANVNAIEALNELAVPVLIVAGSRDREFMKNLPGLLEALPDASTTTVTLDAGHAANLEQPEAFNRAVIDFAHGLGYFDPPHLPFGGDFEDDDEEEPAAERRAGWLVVTGASLVVLGAGLLAASFMFGDDSTTTRATAPAPTRNTNSEVAGARLARTATSLATPPNVASAVEESSPEPTETPTGEPTETPTPEPTAEPDTPTPTATAAPTRTPSPMATPTPIPPQVPGEPGVLIAGPVTALVGAPVVFRADPIEPNGFPGHITGAVKWSGGPTDGPRNVYYATYTFPEDGCYTIAVTIYFPDPVGSRSAEHTIAVGEVTCD